MKRSLAFKIGLFVLLIPLIIGIIVYKDMPAEMAIHFNVKNQADGFSSKEMALFGIPASMLLMYIFVYVFTNLDPKRKNQNDKALALALLLIPILSIVTTCLTISYNSGQRPDVAGWIKIILSIAFILIGNYLPKVKRNYTLGIKLPWTLDNDFVWDKTHRLAGKLWMLCGFISLLLSFFLRENEVLFMANILIMVFIPTVYSYFVYRSLSREK